MPESTVSNLNLENHGLMKYSRASWRSAGTDTFTQPPTQNEDMLMYCQNTLSPLTGVFQRRWAYRTFYPKLDTGSGDSL